MDNSFERVKTGQRAWATRRGIQLDNDGYCLCVDDNLLQPLSRDSRNDFVNGDGTELGKPGERGKIQALHSSSALACNWFDYWRGRDLDPLTRVFGCPEPFSEVALEQEYSTHLGGIGPNLDVILKCADGTLFAIESKFTEPYRSSPSKTFLKPKYFHDGLSLWTAVGLPGCQAVADAVRAGANHYRVLDVAQLLKHMLALAAAGHQWSLCCLWFEIPGTMANEHRRELNEFTSQIGQDSAHFSALTHQELFNRMVPCIGEEHAAYMSYLRDRYLDSAN